MFGSKIGFLHGSTGKFILNVTDSPANVHEVILNFPLLSWPTHMNFTNIFREIEQYLTSSWEERLKNHTIGNLGQIIIFLVPRVILIEYEQQIIIKQLKKLKAIHPDINIIYYTTQENLASFKRLRITDGDNLIITQRINDISSSVIGIPRSLRPALCYLNIMGTIKDQLEDYVEPQKLIIYRLDQLWRINTRKVTIKIIGVGYGTLEICSWNQLKNNITRDKYSCLELSGHNEATLTDYYHCKKNAQCPAIFYQVRGISSLNKCAGKFFFLFTIIKQN